MTLDFSNIICIGGSGRCGTNITKDILALNSQVISQPFEHRMIIDPDGIVDFYTGFTSAWSPYMADRKIKRLKEFLLHLADESIKDKMLSKVVRKLDKTGRNISPRSYHGWNFNECFPEYTEKVGKLIDELTEFSYSGCWSGAESFTRNLQIIHSPYLQKEELAEILGKFLNNLFSSFMKKNDSSFFVEDNTWNILFANELSELMPGMKLVHMFRDPRDVVASFVKQRWCPGELEQSISWYLSIINRWFEIKSNLKPDSFMEMSLENLVADKEKSILSLCEFTEISYEESMLDINLSKSNSGRWKQDFSSDQQKILNDKLGRIIETLGYKV